MTHPSLASTERRLITLFVGGAFLFLIIFEGIWLSARIVLEDQFQRDDFGQSASHIANRMHTKPMDKQGGGRKPQIDVGYIMIDASGQIIENHIGGGLDQEELTEILDMTTISTLPFGQTSSYNGLYIQKMANPRDPSGQILVIKNGGYNLDDILRDILRFLALDILILVPFWFLGRSFVREILEPVGESIETMSHFVHDAGHEMKTPLAIISGNLQILRDMKGKDADLIDTSISTVSSMADTLDGLVDLSSLVLPKKREMIDLKSHTEEIAHIYEADIQQRNITLTINIPEDSKLKVESKHFSILLGNLLKNAITYNREGGTIEIGYREKSLTIRDSGIGMRTEDQEKIFDRFYRVDRSGKTPGSGIGLALVDRIVKLYGWDISVESTLGEGTRFTMKTR